MKILLLLLLTIPAFAQVKPVQVASAETPNGRMNFYVDKVQKKGNAVTFAGYVERIDTPSQKPFDLYTEFLADCKTYQYSFLRTKGNMQGEKIDHTYEKNVNDALPTSPIFKAIKYACGTEVLLGT